MGKRYRAPLPQDDRDALAAYLGTLRAQGLGAKCEALLDLLKKFITDNLRDKGATTANLSSSSSIADNLGFVELDDSYLSDQDWFDGGEGPDRASRSFPRSISMACVVDAYKAMEAML